MPRTTKDQWDRDSENGGVPTFKELGADSTGNLTRQENPSGRFKGQPYDWENRRPAPPEPDDE